MVYIGKWHLLKDMVVVLLLLLLDFLVSCLGTAFYMARARTSIKKRATVLSRSRYILIGPRATEMEDAQVCVVLRLCVPICMFSVCMNSM